MKDPDDYIINYGEPSNLKPERIVSPLEIAYSERKIKLSVVIFNFILGICLFSWRSLFGEGIDWVFGTQALIYSTAILLLWFFEPRMRAYFIAKRLVKEISVKT